MVFYRHARLIAGALTPRRVINFILFLFIPSVWYQPSRANPASLLAKYTFLNLYFPNLMIRGAEQNMQDSNANFIASIKLKISSSWLLCTVIDKDNLIPAQHGIRANFRRKNRTILCINSTFSKLETQNKMSHQLLKQFKETFFLQNFFFLARCFFRQAVLRKLPGLYLFFCMTWIYNSF